MWQLALVGFFGFGTTAYIVRRMLMTHRESSSKLFNLIFWAMFFMPSGWLFGLCLPHRFAIGWENTALLFVGAICWPIVGLVGFRANKEVDTGVYAIMNNLSPIITLIIALTLLHEVVGLTTMTGIALLILSGLVIAVPLLHEGTHSSRYGLFLCMVTVLVGGAGVAYERWMLSRLGLGSYMLYSWTFQTIWLALLARRELRQVPQFIRSADYRTKKLITIFGVANTLRTVCFQAALVLSGSASIMSASTNFLAVSVLIAAYVFLHEKKYLRYKIGATAVGVAGLLLVAS
jgi:drug/metabolite transporter (DMT)-like permease